MNTILWGATGQAIVLRELLNGNGDSVVALFDNDADVSSPFADVPLYRGTSGFERWLDAREAGDVQGLAAIGGSRGAERIAVHALFGAHRIRIAKAIHRSAFVSPDASVGVGVQVMANATLCSRAVVGDAGLINSNATVDHECVLERGVHVGPGAVLAGRVTLEEFVFVGAGAVILPRIRIGAGSIVGAGAVVTRDVSAGVIVTGNPARLHALSAPQ